MTAVLQSIIDEMTPRLAPLGIDTPIRLDVKDHGSIRIEDNKASLSNADAPCIISASAETFQGILDHTVYPAAAMTMGKIKVKGDFGPAVKFSYIYNR